MKQLDVVVSSPAFVWNPYLTFDLLLIDVHWLVTTWKLNYSEHLDNLPSSQSFSSFDKLKSQSTAMDIQYLDIHVSGLGLLYLLTGNANQLWNISPYNTSSKLSQDCQSLFPDERSSLMESRLYPKKLKKYIFLILPMKCYSIHQNKKFVIVIVIFHIFLL